MAMLSPDDPRYQERQDLRLEAIRLSGVEPLPRVLVTRDGQPRLVLDVGEPAEASALDRARGQWAERGYRVEESPLPFGWTRIDVWTKAGNPGPVKRFLGGVLRKAEWVIPFEEYVDRVRGEMVRGRTHPAGVPLEPRIMDALRNMYDAGRQAYKSGDWREFDDLVAAYQPGGALNQPRRRRNPLDLATIVGVGVLAGAVQVDRALAGRQNPRNPDAFLEQDKYGRYVAYTLDRQGKKVVVARARTLESVMYRAGGYVFDPSKSSLSRYADQEKFEKLAELGRYVHGNPLDLATILGVGVLAGAVQGVVEPYVTRHVYGGGTRPVGVEAADNPWMPVDERILALPEGVYRVVWTTRQGHTKTAVGPDPRLDRKWRQGLQQQVNFAAGPERGADIRIEDQAGNVVMGESGPVVAMADNPVPAVWYGRPIVRVDSHRAMDKLLRLVTEDVVTLYSFDYPLRWAAQTYAAIPHEHLARAVAITGIVRAHFKGGMDKSQELSPKTSWGTEDPNWDRARKIMSGESNPANKSGEYLIQVFGKGYLAGSTATASGIKDRYTHDPREAMRVTLDAALEMQRKYAGTFAAVKVGEALEGWRKFGRHMHGEGKGNPQLDDPDLERFAQDHARYMASPQQTQGWIKRVSRELAEHREWLRVKGYEDDGVARKMERNIAGWERALEIRRGNPAESTDRFYVGLDTGKWPPSKNHAVVDRITGERVGKRSYRKYTDAKTAADKLNLDWAAGKIEVIPEGGSHAA